MDAPVPLLSLGDVGGFQILQVEQIVEVLKMLPEHISGQPRMTGVPVPPVTEEIIDGVRDVAVIKVVPQERISWRTVEQTIDLPAPQVMELIKAVPQERKSAPQVMESVAVIKAIPQERISGRSVGVLSRFESARGGIG